MELETDARLEDLPAAVAGVPGCLQIGMAHLTPEQRQLFEAEPNLLLRPPDTEAEDLPRG
jgi:hypothetical protein